jgi:hypothetical protein
VVVVAVERVAQVRAKRADQSVGQAAAA